MHFQHVWNCKLLFRLWWGLIMSAVLVHLYADKYLINSFITIYIGIKECIDLNAYLTNVKIKFNIS